MEQGLTALYELPALYFVIKTSHSPTLLPSFPSSNTSPLALLTIPLIPPNLIFSISNDSENTILFPLSVSLVS